MAGVNNTFSGSLTVTNNVSCAAITTTNITCANLTSFINTSISTQCTNYNSSLVSFINTSIINQCTNYNGSLISFKPVGSANREVLNLAEMTYASYINVKKNEVLDNITDIGRIDSNIFLHHFF